jgi:DNA-binding MarR family transcriptional regulator
MNELPGTDRCHCLAVRRNARYLTRLYDRHLAAAKVSISQFSILALIHERPGISIADLADAMVMERTTLVRALKPLQQEGFISSHPHGPRAALSLLLSAAGSRKLKECEPFWKAAQHEHEHHLGLDRAISIRTSLNTAVREG